MTVELKGNSASCLTAGILLLTRARTFGHRLDVAIVGTQEEITSVRGPALVHSPVLATCGVGRRLGAGAQVIVPGNPVEPLAMCISESGCGEWFYVDRRGEGRHAGTRGFTRLFRDPRGPMRDVGRRLMEALDQLGCTPEPALLDLLFSAPAPPIVRLALLLRAGRAISGSSATLTDSLQSSGGMLEPLPLDCSIDELIRAREDGRLKMYLERLQERPRLFTEEWIDEVLELAPEHPEIEALLLGLVTIGSHLVCMPNPAFVAPLNPPMDAVAVGLGPALSAMSSEDDANAALAQMYCFLGGRFGANSRYPVLLPDEPPPEERIDRWRWFCEGTQVAAATADGLWRSVMDPLQ
jgi:hypothetical protein